MAAARTTKRTARGSKQDRAFGRFGEKAFKKVGTSVRKSKSGLSEKKTSRARRLGRPAFGAAVADRIQHFADGDRCRLRRNSGRSLLSRDVESALAGVRIGAVLHPAVLLTFLD